jgi:hypothetical protein
MTENMKTVCVGRFLVDVPAKAEVSLSREMIDGFVIATVEEGESTFLGRIAAREAEIASAGAGAGGEGTGGMVTARALRVPGMVGRVLVYGKDRTHGLDAGRRVDVEWVSLEVHGHVESLSISLSMKYANEDKAKVAEALLSRLRVRHEGEIPKVPGFCIDRAIFVEPLPPHDTEHIVMHLGLPDHPDLGMALASLPGGGRGRSLLMRAAETDAQASTDEMLRVSKLRSGKRDIGVLPGEEVLERVREFNFATTFGFMWETQGKEDDPLQPFLSLELHAGISPEPGGKPADSSLHEDAVLALWDRVSSSIRLRPSGPPPASDPWVAPPGPTLGASATAGETCPQSGWWQCREGGPGTDVQGGQVQYLRKGERMPQALLLPKQTLWQRVRRIQPSMESRHLTAWTLVDKVSLAQAGPAVAEYAPPGDGPRAATGALVRTGDACPASGWWRCEETHALDGTRWFARGSVLPAATFQVPSGVFGKAQRPDVIQRRSVWALVRLVEAPAMAQQLRRQTLNCPLQPHRIGHRHDNGISARMDRARHLPDGPRVRRDVGRQPCPPHAGPGRGGEPWCEMNKASPPCAFLS